MAIKTFIRVVGVVLTMAMRLAMAEASQTLPVPLVEAVRAYKEIGSDAFLPVLVRKSHLQSTDSRSLQQATNVFRAVEELYGEYIGVELVRSVSISASIRTVYFILKYEHGPLYGMVDAYKVNDREIITNSNVNTNLWKIFPVNFRAVNEKGDGGIK